MEVKYKAPKGGKSLLAKVAAKSSSSSSGRGRGGGGAGKAAAGGGAGGGGGSSSRYSVHGGGGGGGGAGAGGGDGGAPKGSARPRAAGKARGGGRLEGGEREGGSVLCCEEKAPCVANAHPPKKKSKLDFVCVGGGRTRLEVGVERKHQRSTSPLSWLCRDGMGCVGPGSRGGRSESRWVGCVKRKPETRSRSRCRVSGEEEGPRGVTCAARGASCRGSVTVRYLSSSLVQAFPCAVCSRA